MDKNLTTLNNPLVTVMIPVHNGEKYIKFAIESILSQTYKDFELLIINDASNDQTVKIINSFKDARIRLIHNSKQLGLSAVRQKGVLEARGSLIAFLDCDDIAYPERLKIQLNFLRRNPNIVMVGTWVRVIDSKGNDTGRIWRHATSPDVIPSILLFRNCFTQSSVMIRKSILANEEFREHYNVAPDYDLWVRLSMKYKLANIPQVLTAYRLHQYNMSIFIEKSLKECNLAIYRNQIIRLKIIPNQDELTVHASFEAQYSFTLSQLDKSERWLIKLLRGNETRGVYDKIAYNDVVCQYWFKICCLAAANGLSTWQKFMKSFITTRAIYSKKHLLLLFFLCLIRRNYGIDVTSESWRRLMAVK